MLEANGNKYPYTVNAVRSHQSPIQAHLLSQDPSLGSYFYKIPSAFVHLLHVR